MYYTLYGTPYGILVARRVTSPEVGTHGSQRLPDSPTPRRSRFGSSSPWSAGTPPCTVVRCWWGMLGGCELYNSSCGVTCRLFASL